MYSIDTRLHCAFTKTASWWLSLVASGMWPFSSFLWSRWWLNTIHIGESLHNGATEVSQHLRGYGHPDFWLRCMLNPWYENFMSGLRSCENQPPCSWLIVKLLPRLWVTNNKWSHWKPFLWPTVFRWVIMFYFMAKPSALVILCKLCLWTNILGGHKWHNILK